MPKQKVLGILAQQTFSHGVYQEWFSVDFGRTGDKNFITSPSLREMINSRGYTRDFPLGTIGFYESARMHAGHPVFLFRISPFTAVEPFGKGTGTRLEIIALRNFISHLNALGIKEAFLQPHAERLSPPREATLKRRGLNVVWRIREDMPREATEDEFVEYFNPGKKLKMVSVRRMLEIATEDLRRLKVKNRLLLRHNSDSFASRHLKSQELNKALSLESKLRFALAIDKGVALSKKKPLKPTAEKFSIRRARVKSH